MARLGLLELEDAEFEAEGRTIAYRKVSLTLKGEHQPGAEGINLVMKGRLATRKKERSRNTSAEESRKSRIEEKRGTEEHSGRAADLRRGGSAREAPSMET